MRKLRQKLKTPSPGTASTAILCVLAVLAFLLWNHPDIEETSLHTRILLDDIFSGRFFSFYQDTMDGLAAYGYANAAHYHIIFYLLCALWNLPVYLLSKFVAVSSLAFVYWTKLASVGAWVACGFLLRRLSIRLGLPDDWSAWMPFCFWLCPISFFSVFSMGQYDSFCLALILWALILYLDNRMLSFTLVMGAAIVFKMFALFLLIPLLLLQEKRLSRLLCYGALSLWLYLPGTLLFAGRNGDAGYFNTLIAERLFTAELPFSGGASLFLTGLALLYALCFAWRPADSGTRNAFVPYLCLIVLSWLFLCVDWHPQWLILLTPFLLLTMGRSPHPLWWAALQTVWAACFFVRIAYRFPGQLEANLFDFGLMGQCFGLVFSAHETVRTNSLYFSLIPFADRLASVGFCAPLLASLIGKFPVGGHALEERIDARPAPCPLALYAWGCFALCWGSFWLMPTMYAWLRTLLL